MNWWMRQLLIMWRMITTPDPQLGEIWSSRVDPETTLKIINIHERQITGLWVTGVKPPDGDRHVMLDITLVAFWKRKGTV